MKDYEEKVINIMDSTKVNIITQLNKAYKSGYEDGRKLLCDYEGNMEAEYNRGLNEAWEVARKLFKVPTDAIMELFDTKSPFLDFSASEVMAKIKEYEQQKQDAEIKVGDEIITELGNKGVVIATCEDGTLCVWLPTCNCVQMYSLKHLSKTGKHYDQISELLAEMRGENDKR